MWKVPNLLPINTKNAALFWISSWPPKITQPGVTGNVGINVQGTIYSIVMFLIYGHWFLSPCTLIRRRTIRYDTYSRGITITATPASSGTSGQTGSALRETACSRRAILVTSFWLGAVIIGLTFRSLMTNEICYQNTVEPLPMQCSHDMLGQSSVYLEIVDWF
jgi:hypothetical protein